MNIQLLSPAGGMKELETAVIAGADEIYIGGSKFSARSSAKNFSLEEIEMAVRHCHLNDVKLFVAVNTLITTSELNEAIKYCFKLSDIGVDAIIVQDIGLFFALRKLGYKTPIHASTQMTFHNLEGVRYAEKLGFERVVLPREMPISEIKYIRENTKVELEVFGHGALCVSYSGQCLFSSFIGGRSANRGACAQPCRKSYNLKLNSKENINPALLKENLSKLDRYYKGLKNRASSVANIATYENSGSQIITDIKKMISPFDLNTLNYLNELVQIDGLSLKIEGRMKSYDYVYTVVNSYRQAIDELLSDRGKADKPRGLVELSQRLEKSYNRGYTKGYLFGANHAEFRGEIHTGNKGTELGTAIYSDGQNLRIKLIQPLNKGDEVQFKHEFISAKKGANSTLGARADIIYNEKNQKVNSLGAGEIAIIPFKHKIPTNSKLYKTYDTEFVRQIDADIHRNKIPKKWRVNLEIVLNADEPSVLKGRFYRLRKSGQIVDDFRTEITVTGLAPEKPISSPISEADVTKQLLKFGSTNIAVGSISASITSCFISNAELNSLRRELVSRFEEYILEHFKHKLSEGNPAINSYSEPYSEVFSEAYSIDALVDRCFEELTVKQIKSTNQSNDNSTFNSYQLKVPRDIQPLPMIISSGKFDSEIKSYLQIAEQSKLVNANPQIWISHISQLPNLNSDKEKFNYQIVADYQVNITNIFSVLFLISNGCDYVVLSPEISPEFIIRHMHRYDMLHKIGIMTQSELTLMNMKFCPVGTEITGNDKCKLCLTHDVYLVDSFGENYKLDLNYADCSCKVLGNLKTDGISMELLREIPNINDRIFYRNTKTTGRTRSMTVIGE